MRNTQHILIVLVLILQSTFVCFAQSNETEISGNLLEPSHQEIMYATVALLNLDSTFIKGDISSEDGVFKIPIAKTGSYLLRIEHLEYQTYTTEPFTITAGESKNLSDIFIKNQVNRLEVMAMSPKEAIVKMEAEQLTVYVTDGSNTWVEN